LKKYKGILSDIGFLRSISNEKRKQLLQEGKLSIREYGNHEIIHFEGDKCSGVEVILSGEVVVEYINESGDLMIITRFSRGDILGGNLMFSQNPHYPMTITAKKASTIIYIDKEHLFQLFLENPEFLKGYLEFVADHTIILGDKIKMDVNQTIRQRVIKYLEYQKERQHNASMKWDVSKKELAERMGIQRTSLSRELAKMRKEGLIEYDAERVTLLKPFFD
jgi:CRP-like cAMP-binding protein